MHVKYVQYVNNVAILKSSMFFTMHKLNVIHGDPSVVFAGLSDISLVAFLFHVNSNLPIHFIVKSVAEFCRFKTNFGKLMLTPLLSMLFLIYLCSV